LIQAGQGIARAYYFDWDITEQEALWTDSADFGTNCLNAGTPNDGGYLCETGIAYQQVETWLLGNTVMQPCSGPMPPAVGVWTCRLMLANGEDAMVLWDSSQTCSGGTCTTGSYAAPAQFSRYLGLSSGVAQPITNNSVAVGVKPVLLLLPSD